MGNKQSKGSALVEIMLDNSLLDWVLIGGIVVGSVCFFLR